MGEVKADQWDVIEFPAILPNEKPVWPEYWKLEELESVKASLSERKWQAQWQQNPTGEEGAIIKREWWQEWDKKEIPMLYAILYNPTILRLPKKKLVTIVPYLRGVCSILMK